MPTEYLQVQMSVKRVDRDPKTGSVVLTLEQHEATNETMRICCGLVVGKSTVDVMVARETEVTSRPSEQ